MTSQPRAFSPASPTRPSLASCHGSWHGQRGCYDIAIDMQASDMPWAKSKPVWAALREVLPRTALACLSRITFTA
jgi:hypothetical protein